jgi:mRNA interferase MazF
MAFKFGEVILVMFPFTNQSLAKQRPAVIVSKEAYNRIRPDVVVMAITGQFPPVPKTGDAWLSDWQAACLLKPSVVKPVFATLEQGLIIRALGALGAADAVVVKAAIASVLG